MKDQYFIKSWDN